MPKFEAEKEISHLFEFAKSKAKENPKAAREAVKTANKIARKFRKRLSISLKRSFCKECFSYLLPGVTSTVRIGKSRIAYHCHNCGKVTRYPYKREQKARRKQ